MTASRASLLIGAGADAGPITCMQILDGRAYGVVSLGACALMAAWLWRRVEPDLPD